MAINHTGNDLTKKERKNKMKAFTLIQFEIELLERRLEQKKTAHCKLHQIDMQSSTGSQLREEIHKIHGNIAALKWVTDDNLESIYPI